MSPPDVEILSGKVAVVTAASRGIGRACAVALSAAGAHVIAVARTNADLDTLAAASGGRIECWTCDVTSEPFFDRLAAIDSLDILVNNLGMNVPKPMNQVSHDILDRMIAVNVRAVYCASQAAARSMQRRGKGGCIIHMSSQMGHVGAPNRTVYCMTKHAVEGLTKAMAVELGAQQIRVNSVAPTFIETDLTRPMFSDPSFMNSVLQNIPLGRIGQPQEVAAAVVFLASASASLITGTSLKVDGGWTAK